MGGGGCGDAASAGGDGVRAASVAAEKEMVAVTEVAVVALDAARRDFWEMRGHWRWRAVQCACYLASAPDFIVMRTQMNSDCQETRPQ